MALRVMWLAILTFVCSLTPLWSQVTPTLVERQICIDYSVPKLPLMARSWRYVTVGDELYVLWAQALFRQQELYITRMSDLLQVRVPGAAYDYDTYGDEPILRLSGNQIVLYQPQQEQIRIAVFDLDLAVVSHKEISYAQLHAPGLSFSRHLVADVRIESGTITFLVAHQDTAKTLINEIHLRLSDLAITNRLVWSDTDFGRTIWAMSRVDQRLRMVAADGFAIGVYTYAGAAAPPVRDMSFTALEDVHRDRHDFSALISINGLVVVSEGYGDPFRNSRLPSKTIVADVDNARVLVTSHALGIKINFVASSDDGDKVYVGAMYQVYCAGCCPVEEVFTISTFDLATEAVVTTELYNGSSPYGIGFMDIEHLGQAEFAFGYLGFFSIPQTSDCFRHSALPQVDTFSLLSSDTIGRCVGPTSTEEVKPLEVEPSATWQNGSILISGWPADWEAEDVELTLFSTDGRLLAQSPHTILSGQIEQSNVGSNQSLLVVAVYQNRRLLMRQILPIIK